MGHGIINNLPLLSWVLQLSFIMSYYYSCITPRITCRGRKDNMKKKNVNPGQVQPIVMPKDIIFWRRKGNTYISKSYVQEVEGFLVAVNDSTVYTRYPIWLKLDEIEIIKIDRA